MTNEEKEPTIQKKVLTKRLMKQLQNSIIGNLLRNGELAEADLHNSTLIETKIKEYFEDFEGHISIVPEHRDDILTIAEQINKDQYEIAVTLYATFIEHTLNRIISLYCFHNHIDSKTTNEVIRNISIIGKCTWLLTLLGLPSFKADQIKLKCLSAKSPIVNFRFEIWRIGNGSNK